MVLHSRGNFKGEGFSGNAQRGYANVDFKQQLEKSPLCPPASRDLTGTTAQLTMMMDYNSLEDSINEPDAYRRTHCHLYVHSQRFSGGTCQPSLQTTLILPYVDACVAHGTVYVGQSAASFHILSDRRFLFCCFMGNSHQNAAGAPGARPTGAQPSGARPTGARPAGSPYPPQGHRQPQYTGTAVVRSQQEARALDAADGKIDGKYCGAPVTVQKGATPRPLPVHHTPAPVYRSVPAPTTYAPPRHTAYSTPVTSYSPGYHPSYTSRYDQPTYTTHYTQPTHTSHYTHEYRSGNAASVNYSASQYEGGVNHSASQYEGGKVIKVEYVDQKTRQLVAAPASAAGVEYCARHYFYKVARDVAERDNLKINDIVDKLAKWHQAAGAPGGAVTAMAHIHRK